MSGHRQPAGATTKAVRAAIASDLEHRAVVPPLHLSSNFVFDAPGVCGRYDYTRSGNPTRDHLADALMALEGGAACSIVSSGMAAVSVVTHLLKSGDVLIAPHDCYGGCHRLLIAESRRVGFEVHFMDQTAPGAHAAVARLRPRMVWLETPSNPLLRITDLAAWAEAAHATGAMVVADNTFLSPANQCPFDYGADIVVHSTTKFINGHSDVVGGALVARTAELGEELAWWTNCVGASGAPFDAWLTLRGLRTLAARNRVHASNTGAVVAALLRHPLVTAVHHPSIPEHPGHELARRQQSGWGSLVSFEVAGGRPVVEALLPQLEYFTLAESLGGVESLVAHPETMTHASMDADARETAGIGSGLLRLSVGIEDAADLVADLRHALDHAGEARYARC